MKFFLVIVLVGAVFADDAYNTQSSSTSSTSADHDVESHSKSIHYAPAPIPYSFDYLVSEDGNHFGHQEVGDGNGYVSGNYHVLLPDGRVQIVDYKADAYNGYVADVTYKGKVKQTESKPINEYNGGSQISDVTDDKPQVDTIVVDPVPVAPSTYTAQ